MQLKTLPAYNVFRTSLKSWFGSNDIIVHTLILCLAITPTHYTTSAVKAQ